jgi:hypothetical protein
MTKENIKHMHWSLGFGHWSFASESSASDQRNNLQPISFAQYGVSVHGARHNREVQLNCDVRLRDAQLAEQRRHGAAGGDFARFSVNLNCHP